MYPISNALKLAFESNAKQYARITVGSTVINNSRIRLGSFSVNRYALAEDTVVFGSCVAAEHNVTLENGDGAFSTGTFLGNEAFVEVGCDISGTVQYVPLGYFKFDMVTAQASALRLSALDRMMKFEKVVNPTPYPISGTVSSLIDSVCTACGVARGTFTLPVNGTLALSGELTDVKTYRDILRWIGEVTGTIAYIGYDGKLYFGWYSGTEDFSVDPTNRAQGSISDDATTITSVSIVQGENMVTAGTGAKIVIRDNALIPLATGTTAQTIANNLYNHVNGFTYRTFEAGVFPMPHIAPLDCGVYSDLDGNDYDVCCTDWTFTLNANTKIAGKGGKQAYGRGYTLDESVFTARNIAAGAVTAEKIDVQDLAALRATIAGWKISTDALYKDITINGTTYRVSMNAPASPTLTTPAFSVKKRTSSSDPWEEVADILYSGKVISKDFEATGSVKIQPDYDMQAAGVYAIDLEQNGSELYANPNFLNIEEGGSQTHLDATVISSTAADDTMLRMENYGADYAEFRATQGTYGQSSYREGALTPKEVRFSKTNSTASAHMNADEVEVGDSKMESGSFTSDNSDYRASMWTTSGGGFFEVYDQNTGKSSMLSLSELTVNDRDILRTHQSLVGGWGTAIPANANLNTDEYCEVGRFYVGADSTAATHTNCPTRYAYMMDVFAPISSDYENTSYIVREIRTRYGDRYVQYITGSTTKTYSKWVMQLSNASDNTIFADQITSRNLANNASIRNGSFDGQGQETSSNTRIRTGYIGLLPNTQYGIRTNYSTLQIYEVHEYTSSRTFIKYTSVNNSSTILKTSSTTGYIRVLMRYSDNRILTPDEGAKLQIERGEQLSAYSPNQAYSDRIIVPFYSYSDLGTATTDSAFFQAWLKRIAVNYDYFAGKVIEGRVQPNGTGAVFGHLYSGVNANGMPNYSGFSYVSVGVFKYFGTNNGAFYLRSVNYTSEV